MTEFQQPTVGRIVHFHESKDHEGAAALIVGVLEDTVCVLRIFWPDGRTEQIKAPHQAQMSAVDECFWCYPPRV